MTFEVGERVKIIRVDSMCHGEVGRIVEIDGEYHLVKPHRRSFTIELYRCEMEKLP